jgi:hypothetical protein
MNSGGHSVVASRSEARFAAGHGTSSDGLLVGR